MLKKKHKNVAKMDKTLYQNLDIKFYRETNPDLNHFTDDQLILHYVKREKKEGRAGGGNVTTRLKHNNNKAAVAKMDKTLYQNLDINFYRQNNADLNHFTDDQLILHYVKRGKKEGRCGGGNASTRLKHNNNKAAVAKMDKTLYQGLNINFYRNNNSDLNHLTDNQLILHYVKCGKKEGRPGNFEENFLRSLHEPIIPPCEEIIPPPCEPIISPCEQIIPLSEQWTDHSRLECMSVEKQPISVLNILHSHGGGTQTYVDNISILCNHIDYQANIINDEFVYLKNNNIREKCDTNKLLSVIKDNTTIIFHHLLTLSNYNATKLFYAIYNNGKYKKIVFIIHDYHLLFPNNPNPIKNNSLNDIPEPDNLLFVNDLFSKCNLIVFNSHNCLNNYKKYVNMDNYKHIITNTTPDILTNNYDIYPKVKSVYNIGIIGRTYARHKGKELIEKINNILPENKYIFKLLGVNRKDITANCYKKNVHYCGEYDNKEIFDLVDTHQIDIFIFVSVFEETYSYALSIAMQTGLPIFYNDIGSYEERLYGRKNVYPFSENNLDILPKLINDNIDKNNANMSNPVLYKKSMAIYNNNGDYNWILEKDNKYVFDASIIENYLIHKNVCFIHFTNTGVGYTIFLEQINSIKTSGLYNKLDFIFITILGAHIKLANDPKFKVIYYSPNETEWEFPTIKLIKSFSDNIKAKVNILYIHTKGVLNKPHAKEWRTYLEHHLIINHNTCLDYLNDTPSRDCVGVNVNLHPKNGGNSTRCHFSGNFWWSNTRYIKRLDPICPILEKNDRYSSEHYIIGKYHSQPTNIISLHNCEYNFYKTPILPEQYNYGIMKNEILLEYNNFNITNYKKTICVYFVSTIKTAEYRFFNQIHEMLVSGFYDACEEIICFVSGKNDNILSKLQSLTKVKVIQTELNNEMEKYCLNNYKKYINLESSNVVYLHTKGASHSKENNYINDWCKICNYFTINLWKLNMILLKYYSCVGINLMSHPLPHFSGNNWWATGTHLHNLKEPIGDKYLDPEMYLLNKIVIRNVNNKLFQPNPVCIFKSIGNHAEQTYDEKLYKNLSIETILDRIPQNYIFNNVGDINRINLDRITF